jgi:ActR/RegA family two-component response regulator
MTSSAGPGETVLIVDDEEPVRKTFREWLEGAGLGVRVRTAADAESALVQANQETIDLAILDWNLGAGNDGLQLLEDLALFNPDIVAIMITGFAHQATPLDAMRMGVRDYLDKNQTLNRDTFLKAVRRQLERVRPAKRERRLHQQLVAFRSAIDKVLPLVQTTAALHDPLPLPDAVRGLFRFVLRTTGASDGALVVRSYDPQRQPPEMLLAYGLDGQALPGPLAPFARSLAGGVVGLDRPQALLRPEQAGAELQPFERGRTSLLAAPLGVAPGLQAVLEVLDKRSESGALDPGGFTEADCRLAGAAAELGAELLRQALAERQARRVLFDAVAAALGASESMAESLRGGEPQADQPPPESVLEPLRQGWPGGEGVEPDEAVRLAEAVRVLGLRYGPSAVRHCTRLIEGVRQLLDEAAGGLEAGS